MKRINITSDFVIINTLDMKTQTFIKIDEESEAYQTIKMETENFTENMDFPETEIELLKEKVSKNQGAIDFIIMNF
jgi:predicted  nucleic acid-binding Zn-ribbon protein